MKRSILLPVLFLLMAGSSGAHAQTEQPEGSSFWVEPRQSLKRAEFLDVDRAFWLALVLKAGQGGPSQKRNAQLAEEFAPLQPGNCKVVDPRAFSGNNLWLMLNNAPIDDARPSEKVLKVHAEHFSRSPGEAAQRALLRRNTYDDIAFTVNSALDAEVDPASRVVFYSNARASAAIRLSIEAVGDSDIDDNVAGHYLLVLDPSLLADGYFPECRRRGGFGLRDLFRRAG
jgi:hypothetical protein